MKELNEYTGYHPLALRLLAKNRISNIPDVVKFNEIRSLFDFYEKYLNSYKKDFKFLLTFYHKFSKELMEKVGIDINLIHLLKNKLFVLKEDGKYLEISKIFRTYYKSKNSFELTIEEAKELWEKFKKVLENTDLTNNNKETILLTLFKLFEKLKTKEMDEKIFQFLYQKEFRKTLVENTEANKLFKEVESFLNDEDLASSYLNLGILYADKNEIEKAEEYYKKALEIWEKILPDNHPDLASTYLNLGALYSDKNELEKAEEYLKKALEIWEKILPDNHPHLASTYLNLGALYSDKNELDKAEEYLKKALQVYKKGEDIGKYLKLLPIYLNVFINSSNFSFEKLYNELCEYFEFLFHFQKKVSELEIFGSFVMISGIISKNNIKLDESINFKSGVCNSFYKNMFYPAYKETEKFMNSGDDKLDEI